MLPAIDRNGDSRDRALTAELRRQIGATTIGVGHLMTAAETFDAVGVDRLERGRGGTAPRPDRGDGERGGRRAPRRALGRPLERPALAGASR